MNDKAQSAMEYLMTYGWAILIIAVVFVALFQLGVFNGLTFAPRAQAGACQIYRPLGAGSVQNVNYVGSCGGTLPQYVARFDGYTSNVFLSSTGFLKGNYMSFVLWANKLGTGSNDPRGIMFSQSGTYLDTCLSSAPLFSLQTSTQQLAYGGTCPPVNTWTQYAGTYNGANMILYINGAPTGFGANNGKIYAGITVIGQYSNGGGYYFNGLISNVQLYNTSLSPNDISALYYEGIGGAPIALQNLVGWWPLNGNANDYSGNNNNGEAATNVIYTSGWTSGYSAP